MAGPCLKSLERTIVRTRYKLQFRLVMDGLCRRTKQGGLSFCPARIRVGPNTCFSTAAAAAAAADVLLVLLDVFFFFLPTLLRKLYEYDGCCENSQKSSGYKH